MSTERNHMLSPVSDHELRRRNLLRNPAVVRFLSLLETANYSLVINGVKNRVVSVFAVGSSGKADSRDIDLDVVFDSEIGFYADGPLPQLSAQIEGLITQANQYSEQVFSHGDNNLWPGRHIPLSAWPTYARQFYEPTLFKTQMPADFLRCDGGGGIANLIHLNEMLQTGVTVWSARSQSFQIEDICKRNPISSIPTDEAVEYLAISTRDLAKAYLLENAADKHYLMAKAALRAIYSFCVACSSTRIDSYDTIPSVFCSQLDVQFELLKSLRSKLGAAHPISQAIQRGIHLLESGRPLVSKAKEVRRMHGEFNDDISTQTYLLFAEIRRFVELTFTITNRSTRSIDMLERYQKRTVPELVSLFLSSGGSFENSITYYFIQELILFDSNPTGVRDIGLSIRSDPFWKKLGLNRQEELLALRHFDLWWEPHQVNKIGIKPSPVISRTNLIFDVNKRLKSWYENTLDNLLSVGNIAGALRYQSDLDPSGRGGLPFTSRKKYVDSNCLNVHWVVDAITTCVEPQTRLVAYSKVLDMFREAGLGQPWTLGSDEEEKRAQKPTLESIWEACKKCLSEYNLWPGRYMKFLATENLPTIFEVYAQRCKSSEVEMERFKGEHAIMMQLHSANELAIENFNNATKFMKAENISRALRYISLALRCGPNWGAAHAIASQCHLMVDDTNNAIKEAVKAAAVGTRYVPFEAMQKVISSPDPALALRILLDKQPIDSKKAVEEKLILDLEYINWLQVYLDKDGLYYYPVQPEGVPEYQLPEDSHLRRIFLTSIKWEEIGDILGEIDPRITKLYDLANEMAVVWGKENGKRDHNGEVSPESLSLVQDRKNQAHTFFEEGALRKSVTILAPMEKFHLLLPVDYLYLGQALLRLKRLRDAEKALNKGYCLNRNDVRFLRVLAEIDWQKRNINSALAKCEKALVQQPDYCNLHLTVAEIYRDVGDEKKCLEYYKSALLCSDLSPQQHWVIGERLRRDGHFLEACVACLRMLMKGGDIEKVRTMLVVLLKDLGKIKKEDAKRLLDESIPAVWDDLDDILRLGSFYDDIEAFREAIYCYQRAVALDPNDASVYFNMGMTYEDWDGHDEQMLESYTKAVELAPKEPDLICGLAHAHKQLGNFDKTIELYRRALQIDPGRDGTWTTLGNCYIVIHDLKRALECHQRAVTLNPDNELNIRNLAGIYLQKEDWGKAIEISLKAMDKWTKAKKFRSICTIAILEGGLSLQSFPQLAPDFVGAVRIAARKGWIGPSAYSSAVLEALTLLGTAFTETVGDIKGSAQVLPFLGFGLAFCERKMNRPSFDPAFLRLNLWNSIDLARKVLLQKKQRHSMNLVNSFNEFLKDFHESKPDKDPIPELKRIPHAVDGLLIGYELFQVCFPK